MDVFSESFDPKRDQPKDRVVTVDNGADFHIKQEDPFGFWRISREHGQVPKHLSGVYTSYDRAKKAVDLYINNQPKPVKETKEKNGKANS